MLSRLQMQFKRMSKIPIEREIFSKKAKLPHHEGLIARCYVITPSNAVQAHVENPNRKGDILKKGQTSPL